MPDEEPADPIDELMEQQLRSLREGGESLDLSHLPDDEASEARDLLDIVDALAYAGPAEVKLVHDPVAIRLGLVDPPRGEPFVPGDDDPVGDAVRDLESRFSFVASPAHTDGTDFVRRFECRSVVEHVLVVVSPNPVNHPLNARHARSAFALSEELSAVAYCAADATQGTVLTFGDCHSKVDPARGWLSATDGFSSDPLGLALGRYFEQSDPQWEAVRKLGDVDMLAGTAEDVVTSVERVIQGLATSKPRLPHKSKARDFVLAQSETLFTDWATRIQLREANGTVIAEEIMALVVENCQ